MVSIFSEYIWVGSEVFFKSFFKGGRGGQGTGDGADLFPLNVQEYFKKEHHNIILGNQKYCKQIGELKRSV